MAKRRNRWPGLCGKVANDDGLPVREVGQWTEKKLFFWNRYIEITTSAMVDKPEWSQGLVYVDLFSGPGVCTIRGTNKRIPGSVLIAANAPKPFAKIIACEMQKELAHACESRLKQLRPPGTYSVLEGDCNDRISDVVAQLPQKCLTLAFVDPEGLDVDFRSLEALSHERRVDLLILFPDAIDIVRNVELYSSQESSNLDRMLGPESDWRDQWSALPNQSAENARNLFTRIFASQLRGRLGYKKFGH